MAASEHLNPRLFHGTTHPFEVGDIVEPRSRNTLPRVAFASEDLSLARTYAGILAERGVTGGGIRMGKTGPARVFEVAPVDPEENLTYHGHGKGIYVSRKGFRVIGEVED